MEAEYVGDIQVMIEKESYSETRILKISDK